MTESEPAKRFWNGCATLSNSESGQEPFQKR